MSLWDRVSGKQDLAERLARAEEAVAELERALEAERTASDAKTRALATVSHELRTPLAGIVAYANMLRDEVKGPLSADQKAVVDTLLQNADQLLYLINDLLDVSKMASDSFEMTMAMVALEECIESAYATVAPQLQAKGLTFAVDLPEDGIRVTGSHHRLQQVFVNLLHNAVKFTDEGGITVTAHQDGRTAEVTVADTGIGIPPEMRDKVFDEFRQADEGIRRKYGGAGLGLAIAKGIVTRHGGTIAVAPNAPHGTRVTVRLPARP